MLCPRSGAHIVYLIGYIKGVPNRVLSLNLLSAEPMPYKARLGARFVYPIGYSMYVPDRVQISLYLPYFEGLLEFCVQVNLVCLKNPLYPETPIHTDTLVSPITNCLLQIALFLLTAANWPLLITNCFLPIANCQCQLPISSCKLQITND